MISNITELPKVIIINTLNYLYTGACNDISKVLLLILQYNTITLITKLNRTAWIEKVIASNLREV